MSEFEVNNFIESYVEFSGNFAIWNYNGDWSEIKHLLLFFNEMKARGYEPIGNLCESLKTIFLFVKK